MIGVYACGHALVQACFDRQISIGGTAILAAAVAMEEGGVGDWSGTKCLLEGIHHETGAEMICETPAGDLSGVEVENHGEVKPTLGGWK